MTTITKTDRREVRKMEIDVANVITAIGTIVLGYFTYNQYTKNKLTDLKLKQLAEEDKRKNRVRADNSAIIFGELWTLLHELDCDRVYIVQPHPLGDEEMLSVYFEVKQKGVSAMRPRIQKLKISDVAKFASDLAKNLFWHIKNIDVDVKDNYAKSILLSNGCEEAFVKRLSDNRHDWVGSIFCEFSDKSKISEEEAHKILHNAAMNIQYILPEIKD